LQSETSLDELTAYRHELGDVELYNLQSAGVHHELATGEQRTFTDDWVHIHKDAPTDESAVLENLDQLLHDAAGLNNVIWQKDSLTSDLCDVNLCHKSLASKDQFGLNFLGEFNGTQSITETRQDQASDDSINTQEVKVAVKECTDINDDMTQLNTYESYDKLIKEYMDCSVLQHGSSEIQSRPIDQGANGRDGSLSRQSSSSSYQSVNLLESGVYGSDSCYKDAHCTIMHDRCSAEFDISENRVPEVDLMWHTSAVSPNSEVKQTGSYAVKDPELHHMLSSLACENSKFVDIPVENIAQRVKLTLDSNELDVICSDVEQMAQNEHSSLFSYTLDNTENSTGFPSAVEFQQNIDCLDAGIYAFLSGMELRDDMELIPVEGTKTISDMNGASDIMNTVTSLNSDDKNKRIEFSQLTADRVEMYKAASTSHIEEQLETVSKGDSGVEVAQQNVEVIGVCDASDMDDNHGELPWLSENGVRLLMTPEQASINDQTLQCTTTVHDVGQEKSQYDLTTEEVRDNGKENSEPADTADEKARTSTALVSASGAVMQNEDMLVSLETIHVDTAGTGLTKLMDSAITSSTPEMADSYLGKTENLKVTEDGEHGNNTGCASTYSAGADLEHHFDDHIDAGSGKNSTVEHHPDLPLLNTEETSSTVCYASEDSPFSVYEQSEKQLKLFTVDASPQTQRLELDDLTLTVTCFIPEENEELLLDDDDMLEDVDESEHLDAYCPSSSRELTANDPAMSSDLAHYIDYNVVSADKILPKRRSSEFMLSYLMPIDEAAEFTEDADADIDDQVPSESHTSQPGLNNMKTEPSNNNEQKLPYNINASPTVEHAYHLCHELTDKIQHDEVAATSYMEEPALGSSLSNVCHFGVNACNTESSDDKDQIICEENRNSAKNPDERNNGSVSGINSPTLWFSANHQDTQGHVVDMSKYLSEYSIDVATCNSKAATHATTDTDDLVPNKSHPLQPDDSLNDMKTESSSHLLGDNNEHTTAAEHTTLTLNLPLQACSEDQSRNSNDIFMLLAADSTQHSSSTYSAGKTAESSVSNLGDKHFLDINAFKQNKLEGIGDTVEHLGNNCKNTKNSKTVELDMEIFSSDETVLSKDSAVTHTDELKCDNNPCKPNVETELQLCERPVLRSNDIHTVLDTLLKGLIHPHETGGVKQQTTMQEDPLSPIAANDIDISRSSASVPGNSSTDDEPAIDVLTDFESTLEQLHSAEYGAHTD